MGRADPSCPACARQSIPISAAPGPGAIGVQVATFTAVLSAGQPAAAFEIEDRVVSIELTKLVRVSVDVAVNVASNGQVSSLQDAMNQSIDCSGLRTESESIAASLGLSIILARAKGENVESACGAEKQRALDAILAQINSLGSGYEVMEFDQIGRAIDTNGNGRPEELQQLSVPDTIRGRFRLLVRDVMAGAWAASAVNP